MPTLLITAFSVLWWRKKKAFMSKFNFSKRKRIISRSSSISVRFGSVEILYLHSETCSVVKTAPHRVGMLALCKGAHSPRDNDSVPSAFLTQHAWAPGLPKAALLP